MSARSWSAAALLLFAWACFARDVSVKLVFAGDIMLDDGPGRLIAKGGDPLQDFASTVMDSDLAIANLECPVATGGSAKPGKIYTFRAKPAALRVLQGRFQALALANNHSGDYGKAAFLETIAHLDEAGFQHFGGGRNLTEAHAPLWITRKGLRIALLGYDEFKPRSFEAGPTWPGIAWSEDALVIADIRAARAAGADLVIPMMHWGWEREPEPSARQRALARLMIDAGADMVVGGHPHVTQGVEYYKGKMIVYSLGNFIFDGFFTAPTRTGWVLRVTVDRHGMLDWDTVGAVLDDNGSPHRAQGIPMPCGRKGDSVPRICSP